MGTKRQHVVIIGGGFGGLNVARAVAGANVDVTLVDRTNHHLFQPLLYQVATGILPEGLIAPAIRRVVQSLPNTKVVLAEVQDIDLHRKLAIAKTPDQSTLELPYDFLVVAAGSTHSYFGKDEWAEFAPGMKTVDDARYQRDAILSKFEMAELATDPQERAEWLTFVVIGAGPTGVELAGQIAELAHQVLPKDYSEVDTRGARILLLEGAPAVLPPFKPKLQQYTKDALEKLGVEIRVSTLAVRRPRAQTSRRRRRTPSRSRGPTGLKRSAPAAGSGPPVYRRHRWPKCWPRRVAPRPTGRAGSSSVRTVRCPATRRSSPSEIWPTSAACPVWRSRPCRRASTSAN